MKICQVVIEYGALIGVNQPRLGEKQHFNRRNLVISLIYCVYFISITAFLLFDAHTFRKYTEVFFTWMTVLMVYFGYSNFILKTNDLFRLRDNVEKFIENGKQAIFLIT